MKQIIQELYNIVEPDTVQLIAGNHIIAELEQSLRESVKILQLTGHARLENVLELIKSKMVSEMSNLSPLSPTFNAAATVPNYVSQQDRFDRLENLVEKLSHQVAILTTNSNPRRQQNNITSIYCENCRKPGHVKDQCFKLKTCNKCLKKGHIAKFCKEEHSSNATKMSAQVDSKLPAQVDSKLPAQVDSKLPASPRIILKIKLSDATIDFLYGPWSMYTMLRREIFDKLPTKSALMNINRTGLRVAQQSFKIDGVAYLNLELQGTNSSYILQYEPVVISGDISSCIFGINSEKHFYVVRRLHSENFIIFKTNHGKEIKMKIFKENSVSCAVIKVLNHRLWRIILSPL